MPEIHISDVRTFRQCRRKWNWNSPLRENLEPIVPYLPFFIGRAIHYCTECLYRDGEPFSETLPRFLINEYEIMEEASGPLWDIEIEALREQEQLISDMLNHYDVWRRSDTGKYSDSNLEFINMEIQFVVPLKTATGRKSRKLTLGGRFDGLVRHLPSDTYWIWETKTTRSITELERSLINDEQCGAYLYAARHLFPTLNIKGVLYNIMRKKVPTRPQVLKSGLLSQAQNIDTTFEAYLQAVRETHGDWEKETIVEIYGNMLNRLRAEPNKFFARVPVYRTEAETDILAENLYHTGMEMSNHDMVAYPSPGWATCSFCRFKAPCLSMNAGGDYRAILEADYRPRTQAVSFRELEESDDGD